MKFRSALWLLLCSALVFVFALNNSRAVHSQTTKGLSLSMAEQDLLNEINQARAHPQTYASYLEKLKPMFKDKMYIPSGGSGFETQEGWTAVDDAIKFLRLAKPLGPLTTSQGLCLAALSHVKDQGSSGATGHKGSDSAFIEERVKPYGTWQGGIGENLTYGNQSAREHLLMWLIDDGFSSRGHRNRVMSANYKVAGISCGAHPEFGTMCVLTLAGGFLDAGAAKSSTVSSPKNRQATAVTTTKANSNSNKPQPRKY